MKLSLGISKSGEPEISGLHAFFSSHYFYGFRLWSWVVIILFGEYSNFGDLQAAPRSPFRTNFNPFDSIRHNWRENLQSKKNNYHRRTSKVLRDLIMLIWPGKLNRSSRPQSFRKSSTKR